MPENNDIKIDTDGNFFRWEKVLDIVSKIESGVATGSIGGMSLDGILKHHLGKKMRVTIEVRNES